MSLKILVCLILAFAAPSLAVTEVTVSGSTTVGPLGILCAEAFNDAQNNYHVSVSQTGTGAGITSIAEGKSDLAMASREVSPEEKSKYGDRFQEMLIGYDGIAIIVSRSIYDAGIRSLTREQVEKIYSGEIDNWKDMGGPDREIYAISREQGSGTRDSFLEDIFGSKKAETPGVDTYSAISSEIKAAIAGSDRGIGYLGYSYAQGRDIGALKLDGIELTPETAKNKLYPLARTLYLVTFGDPKPGAQEYIKFVKGPQGQKIAVENGFIPTETIEALSNVSTGLIQGDKADDKAAEKKILPGFELALAFIGLVAVSYLALLRRG